MIKKKFTSGLIIFLKRFQSRKPQAKSNLQFKKKKDFLKVQKTSFGCRVKGKPVFCHCPPAERLKNVLCILPYSFYVHVINSHVHPFPNEIYTPCSTPLFPSFSFLPLYLGIHPTSAHLFQHIIILSDSTVWMYQNLFNHFHVAVHFAYFQMFAMFM